MEPDTELEQLCWLYKQDPAALARRLSVIERLMCGPLSNDQRKALRSEYLFLTEPEAARIACADLPKPMMEAA